MDGQQPESQTNEPTWQFKPGETISPRQATPAPASPTPPQSQSVEATPAPKPEPQPQPAPSATPAAPAATAPQPTPPAPQPARPQPQGDFITWTASEYISHEKTTSWHVGLIGASLVIAVLAWVITKDFITSLVIVVAGSALSLYGARKPNELQYQLDSSGLSIGPRHYLYGDFRAFSVIQEGPFASVSLIPSKRFAPMVTLYFDPEDEDHILTVLGTYLPHQERGADVIEAFMRRIRF